MEDRRPDSESRSRRARGAALADRIADGRELHSTISEIQWLVTGYLLSLAAVIPITGWAARRFGAKPVYLLSVLLFTVGSALCGLATSSTELIVFRVLQGADRRHDPADRPTDHGRRRRPEADGRVMSVVAAPAMLAPILGPTIGGLILDNVTWLWIFYLILPIGVIAIVAALRVLPRIEPEATGRLDYLGLAPVAAFARHTPRVPRPLLDLRLYRRPTFSCLDRDALPRPGSVPAA